MDLTHALAATSSIQLGDATYELSPLTLGDMATFRQWANDRHIDTADERCAFLKRKSCLTQEEAQRTYAKAFDETKNGIAEARAAGSTEGGEQLILLSLKHRHPDMTLEKLRPLLKMGDVQDVREKVERLSGFFGDDDDAPADAGDGGSTAAASDPNAQTPAAASTAGETSLAS
jgi:hypothetical protein